MGEDSTANKNRLGTLAGWGTFIAGIAAILTTIINSVSNNSSQQQNPRNPISNITLQDFDNKTYFYGKIGAPNVPGEDYVFFSKIEDQIIGLFYTRNSDNNYCFKGTSNQNSIINVTLAYPPGPDSGGWTYSTQNKIHLLGDYPHELSGTPPSYADKGLQDCIDVFKPQD